MVAPRGDRKKTSGHPGIIAGSEREEEDKWGDGHAVGTGTGRYREDGLGSQHSGTGTRDAQVVK